MVPEKPTDDRGDEAADRNTHRWNRLGEVVRGRPLLLTAPAVVFLVVVFGWPLLRILRESLGTGDDFGLSAYVDFLSDPLGVEALVRTGLTALGITFLCIILGYPYAYFLTVVKPRTRFLLILIILVPFWSSVMVRTFAWLVLLGEGGPIKVFLEVLGFGQIRLVRNLTGVVIGMVHVMLPFMVLPMYATMRAIDRRLLDAGQALGARPWIAFCKIYFPLSLPGVYAGSVVVLMLSLGFYVTPAILGSPREALLSQLIVSRTLQVLDLQSAGAMAAVLMVVAFGLLAVFSKALRRGTTEQVGATE